MELGRASRDSSGFGAMREGLTSRGDRNLRIPLRFRLRPQGPCRVGTGESGLVLSEEGNPAGLSSCSGGLRPLVELCVEPTGLCGRCTGAASSGHKCRQSTCPALASELCQRQTQIEPRSIRERGQRYRNRRKCLFCVWAEG